MIVQAMKDAHDLLASKPSVKDRSKRNFTFYNDTFGELNYMENKLEYVKVKIKSLAAEAKIIRSQEQTQKTKYRDILLRNQIKEAAEEGNLKSGHKIGKWTVSIVTNDNVVLTRHVNVPGTGETKVVSRSVNLNWKPTERKYETHVNTFWGLREHRETIVRWEARASLIAYGFLRGKKYHQIENAKVVYTLNGTNFWNYEFKNTILPRVIRIVQSYCRNDENPSATDVENWIVSSYTEQRKAA